MNIFLTGASGYIGGSVAMGLLAAGHSVRGLTRGPASADRLRASGIEPVIGTLDDAELLGREARASDGVVNTASADHEGAVRALITGLEGSGKPLLHTSGSSVIGDDARGERVTDQVFDEDTPFIVSPSKQARRALDLVVLGARDKGIRSAVVCPTLIYGVGRGLNTQSVQIPFLVSNALEQGIVQIVGSGRNVWSNVHLDDVVALYLLVLERPRAGGSISPKTARHRFRRSQRRSPSDWASGRPERSLQRLPPNGGVRSRRTTRSVATAGSEPSALESSVGGPNRPR